MRVIISNAKDVEFISKIELNRLIPEGLDGYALSYDKGQGRVLISNSVWGLYCLDSETCMLQYEEGLVDFLTLFALTTKIIDKLKREFDQNLVFNLEGLLEQENAKNT